MGELLQALLDFIGNIAGIDKAERRRLWLVGLGTVTIVLAVLAGLLATR
jgi:hypothetical protein